MKNVQLREAIMSAMADYPAGATSRQIATRLNLKLYIASRYMGMLRTEGLLDRGSQSPDFGFTYRVRVPEAEAPPVQWQPELRIAERMIREDEMVTS